MTEGDSINEEWGETLTGSFPAQKSSRASITPTRMTTASGGNQEVNRGLLKRATAPGQNPRAVVDVQAESCPASEWLGRADVQPADHDSGGQTPGLCTIGYLCADARTEGIPVLLCHRWNSLAAPLTRKANPHPAGMPVQCLHQRLLSLQMGRAPLPEGPSLLDSRIYTQL